MKQRHHRHTARHKLSGISGKLISCVAVPRSVLRWVEKLGDDSLGRFEDCMSCSVRSLVMPHSATSSDRGEDMRTIVSWNSGV
jgi:hypothetical protein